MYLEQVHIKNLLSFEDALLSLAKYNVIVGPNNSGKTNFLRILAMIAKNERIDSFHLKRRLKLDPEKPTEITLRVRMEENESSMIFQCIFGMEEAGAQIHESARTIDVTIVWDEAAQDTLPPKFTMFRFDNGFTVILTSNGNVAFDPRSYSDDKLKQAISAWYSKNNYIDLEKFIDKSESSHFPTLEDKSLLISSVVNQQSNIMEVLGSNFVIDIPMYIKYDGNSETPISLFVRGDQESSLGSITLGLMFNKIFEKSFAIVNETHPLPESLSMAVAGMRNKRPNEYDELRNMFKDISGGIMVQAKQSNDQHEKIWFIEDTQECAIEDSASGYRALVNILYVLLNKPSGIVAIDEPEIHFHPIMISRLHEELRKISKHQCSQIIIATHSSKFVTYEQAEQRHGTRLIMMTRPKTVTVIHANTDPNPLGVKPHLFNPEIFFGKCTML